MFLDIKTKFKRKLICITLTARWASLIQNVHILIKNGVNIMPSVAKEVDVILQLFDKENYHYHMLM